MRKTMNAVVGTGVVTAAMLLVGSRGNTAVAQPEPPPPPAVAPSSAIQTEFRSGTVDVPETKGTEATKTVTVSFQGRNVVSAEVLLKGFDVKFVDAEHAFHEQKVRFDNLRINGESVTFDTHLLVRDNTGNMDDPYAGTVDYVVIARTR